MKKAFTLIELLVVISIIAVLMGILIPTLSQARELATVTVVDSDLRQFGLALEVYFENNRKYPPTHADCGSGSLNEHQYQAPTALIEGNYLPAAPKNEAMSTTIEDKFHREHTYKYRSIGEVIYDRDRIDRNLWSKLWIPDNFPTVSSLDINKGQWRPTFDEYQRYSDSKSSFALQAPVTWVVFSLGPKFDEKRLEEQLGLESRFPVSKELWYTPKKRRGFIVRMRLKDGSQAGSFSK